MICINNDGQSEPDGYLYPCRKVYRTLELPEVAQRALLAAGG